MRLSYLLLVCLMIVSLSSWTNKTQKTLTGSGYVLTDERTTADFDAIRVSRNIKVFIAQGEKFTITVEADDNLLPYIKTEVVKNTLNIYLPEDIHVKKYADMNVFISMPQITSLKATTSSKIKGTMPLKVSKLEVDATTSAEIKLDLEAVSVEAEATTSAKIELKGSTDRLEAEIATSGELSAEELEAKLAKIEGTTGSNIKISVSGQLEYKLSTGAKLSYKGNPQISHSQATTGSSAKRRK